MVRKFPMKCLRNIKLTIDLHYIKTVQSMATVWLSLRVALVARFFEKFMLSARSRVLSVPLSDCGRKNEFYRVCFRTNEIYVM